jgi:hypothetical protein
MELVSLKEITKLGNSKYEPHAICIYVRSHPPVSDFRREREEGSATGFERQVVLGMM